MLPPQLRIDKKDDVEELELYIKPYLQYIPSTLRPSPETPSYVGKITVLAFSDKRDGPKQPPTDLVNKKRRCHSMRSSVTLSNREFFFEGSPPFVFFEWLLILSLYTMDIGERYKFLFFVSFSFDSAFIYTSMARSAQNICFSFIHSLIHWRYYTLLTTTPGRRFCFWPGRSPS